MLAQVVGWLRLFGIRYERGAVEERQDITGMADEDGNETNSYRHNYMQFNSFPPLQERTHQFNS